MADETTAPESVLAENVLDVPEKVSDEAEKETPPVADSTPAPEAGETPPKKADGFSKRIDELTRDYYAERRAREASDREAQELRQRVEALTPKPVQTPSAAPRLEDFAFDEEKYRTAVVEYAKTEAARTTRETLQQERQQAARQAKAETFAQRQSEYLSKSPEYQAKVLDNPRLPISEVMREIIIESPLGPQMAEYLADHPEIAHQVYQLSDPMLIGRELGRIEARLEKPEKPVIVPKVSEAPPPPAKIEAVDAAPPKSIDDPKISDAEFARIRRRQISQRR